MAKKQEKTGLMKQYDEMKLKHPDAILLFRVGDFYETFADDAIAAAEILGITLTKRANGAAAAVDLAGFPHHALDTYLPKLVRAGRRVAICEQLEDPKKAKGLVKRGITELVTPGVSMGDNILNHRENNFLAAVHMARDKWGIAFLDISTGEYFAAEGSADYAEKLLDKFSPKEVLIERGRRKEFEASVAHHWLCFELDDWVWTEPTARERLMRQFATTTLKGFGIHTMTYAVIAAGAILQYLDLTNHTHTSHITALSRLDEDTTVRLDAFTIRNLELLEPLGADGKSLLEVIDRTVTPMGARLLRRWVVFPLKDAAAINKRLDVVEHFFRHSTQRQQLKELLEGIGDLERTIAKVAQNRVTPRELVQMHRSLALIEPIKEMCLQSAEPTLMAMGEQLNPCTLQRQNLQATLTDNPPAMVRQGGVIRAGVDSLLDELRHIQHSGKQYLAELQQRESQRTGITSLKVAYNNVFGYYLEVTNAHRTKVPTEWIRKQTLVNAERYITPELKEYEDKITTAQERIEEIEERIFSQLVSSVAQYIQAIILDASLLAQLDCLSAFTRVAQEHRYCRPVVDQSMELDIVQGRHPVIECQLPPGEKYIANSVHLSSQTEISATDHNEAAPQIMMITGPNMSGKSALLRQTALTVLMAQIGCFVAADSARIGVVDKIFTRVGASDNISHGESTFMVEMTEAASILNNLTPRSLVLFDELGRGTSTYDGISIAWAIVEHIHNHPSARAKTLFATHYHELNEMERTHPAVRNFNVAVHEHNGKVVFLRQLTPGGSAHSFGIHVARLAGMPQSIVRRADQVLQHLEQAYRSEAPSTASLQPQATPSGSDDTAQQGMQYTLFQLDDPVLAQIRDQLLEVDINHLTPLDALNKLHQIHSIITGK